MDKGCHVSFTALSFFLNKNETLKPFLSNLINVAWSGEFQIFLKAKGDYLKVTVVSPYVPKFPHLLFLKLELTVQ